MRERLVPMTCMKKRRSARQYCYDFITVTTLKNEKKYTLYVTTTMENKNQTEYFLTNEISTRPMSMIVGKAFATEGRDYLKS